MGKQRGHKITSNKCTSGYSSPSYFIQTFSHILNGSQIYKGGMFFLEIKINTEIVLLQVHDRTCMSVWLRTYMKQEIRSLNDILVAIWACEINALIL